MGISGSIEDSSPEDINLQMSTNFMGYVNMIQAILPSMRKQNKGTIINISSIGGLMGLPYQGFYSASKAATTIYLEGLRVELKRHDIKVITVKPGFVKTPMTDKNEFRMPLLMDADKAANIIIDGIKKEKRVIQFPWQMVLLTRIIGMIPGSIYEYLVTKIKV